MSNNLMKVSFFGYWLTVDRDGHRNRSRFRETTLNLYL